jgi:hypothetical protein
MVIKSSILFLLLVHKVPKLIHIIQSNNIMRNFNVNSTAISTLSMEGEQVNIQFTSTDKQYTFRASDPSTFVADLEQVIADPTGSVGSYIHRARTSELLVEV